MKIVIRTKNINLTEALRNFVQKEIESLEKFAEILQAESKYFNGFLGKGKPRVEAWLELTRETQHHRKGDIFRAECQMRLPGRSIRAEALSEDLKTAIIEVKDKLQRALKEYKEKKIAKTKRGTRAFKKDLKLVPEAKLPARKGERIREEGR